MSNGNLSLKRLGARSSARLAWLALAGWAWGGHVATATAQRASEAVLAREQFRAGVAAARAERWQEALEAFQRSYELNPRPLTLLNLAGAYAQTGHLVEAVEAYRTFLLERRGVSGQMRADAEAQLASLEPRIPRVRITVLGIAEGDVVRLDAYELSAAALEQPLPVDPGDHTVSLERAGAEPLVVPFRALERTVEDVLVDARALATALPRLDVSTRPVETAPETPNDAGVWLAIGGAAAVVVGAIVVGVVVATVPGPATVGTLRPGQIAID